MDEAHLALVGEDVVHMAGLAVLVRCSDDIPAGNRFIVAAYGPATVRPIELTGLTERFNLADTLSHALPS